MSQVELILEGKKDGEHKATCHLMPCKIETKEMEAKVKEYFWPTIKNLQRGGDHDQGRKIKNGQQNGGESKQDRTILTATFRGRPLQGRCVKLPEGYTGHVINKSKTDQIQSPAARTKVIEEHFDSFTYWNWDQLPEDSDSVVKALDWLEIAKAIHDPI